MHYHRHPVKSLSLLAAGTLSLISNQALASAFGLHEQNAALLGTSYAGSAAVAEDASTNWYNSAGLTRLHKGEFVISGVNISTQTQFEGTTTLTTFTPFGPAPALVETGQAGGGTARLLPAVHGAYKINKDWAVGLSVVTPFGLSSNYETDSIARYNATESELKTIDISPSVAFRATDWLSFGAGFDAEYAEAKIDAVIGCTVCVPGNPTGADSISKNKANSWGWGYHAGFLAVSEKTGTQVGANFHSNIDQELSGRSKLHGPLNPLGYESTVTGDVDLPWRLVASITQKVSEKVTLLGSVEYTAWSSIEKLELSGVETGGSTGSTAVSDDILNYENTWGFFGGIRYQAYKGVMLSVGGGYEQTPTNDVDRDLRLPDADRWWASAGVRWVPEAAKHVQLDIGYAHLWGQEVNIDKILPASTQVVTATGTDTSQVNILGAQLSVRI
jgi:long-chain fatty acid transport protein